MADIDAQRIVDVQNNEDFNALMNKIKAEKVATILALNSSPETRDKALADHHAVDEILSRIRIEAQKAL